MKSAVPSVCFGLLFWTAGCNPRMIHQDIPDERVFVREWTLPTSSLMERDAGDRGSEFSNPVVFQNSIVFGSHRKGLVAMYPKTQQIRWTLPIPKGVSGEILREEATGFFGAGDGYLYAVDLERGRVKWKYAMRSPYISKPAFVGGKLFVTSSDDSVYAFDAGSGQMLWTYRRRSANPTSILGASTPTVDQNQILVGMSDGYLVSLTPEEGKVKWEKRLNEGKKFTDIDAQPVVSEDMLFVPAYDGALYALKRENGDVLWKADIGGNRQVLISGDRVFQASSDGWIVALDRRSGKVLWKFEMDLGVPTKLSIIDDRFLVFGSSSRYLYALRMSDGNLRYRFDVGYESGFSGSPLYDSAHRLLVILSKAGNLYSFTYHSPKT